MSVGCPVLANRTSSLPEICGDAAFYFDSSDPEQLAQRLQSIVEDKQGLADKRKLGEEQVKLYDWGRCAHSTLAVYRQVI
jgi:glycosyltransferase involved in cell wall biosynthesis